MFEVWTYAIASVIGVSLISLIGIITFWISRKNLHQILNGMISFAAGSLLATAFFHLIPELIEERGFGLDVSGLIILGIVISFALEKFLHWRHCHHPTTKDHPHPVGWINLMGDFAHNLTDGIIIGGAYMVSIPVGITTTVAVALHEIPQEIGDFGILLHAGFSRKKAIVMNLLVALSAVIGVVAALLLSNAIEGFEMILVPVAVGNFIYIAMADLIPELHKESRVWRSVVQLVFFLGGLGLMMWMFTQFDHEHEHGHQDEHVIEDHVEEFGGVGA